MCIAFKTSQESTYAYFFPTIPTDYKLISSLTTITSNGSGVVFSTNESCIVEEAMFCFPCDDVDDIVQYLGLSCNKSKHYSTMVEACSTWIIQLEERGKRDMYAKISPTWPCDIYSIQCSEGRKKEIVTDLICVCPKNPELITSKIFCVIYDDKFVCSNFDKITIYFFDTKRWALKSSKASMMREILTGMYRFIADVCESYMKTIEPAIKIIDFIQLSDNRRKMMYTCAGMLYKEGFEELLDSRRNVIGMKGGVYDFIEDRFRRMESDDYITLSTRIPFVPLDYNSEATNEVLNLLAKVFPNEDIRRYFMRFISSCLEGQNANKIFSIWSGSGDNGKTVMVSLVEGAFGDYTIKMPTSLLMGKRVQSSAATLELAMLKERLIALVQEPDEGDKLNLGIMKELTGNDSLYIRGLYEEGTIIPQTTKFVLIANRIPQMNRTIHDLLTTHLKDINFSNKIPLLAPVFMRLVIEEYKQYLTYGLEEPNEVKDCIETFHVSNDIFGQFLSANVEKNSKSIVAIKELYDTYKYWSKDMFPTMKVKDISSLRQYLVKNLYTKDAVDQIQGLSLI
uniref:Bacteriophage/plasmid primase P4 C-terminal domain-containing protein n=1 Tax=Physcomitrium patens TaxID=3218 RepID=A0A2K1L6D3_PHYPA|nr:hypothetical protein PHYPA_000022 [Physcomitrium patens]